MLYKIIRDLTPYLAFALVEAQYGVTNSYFTRYLTYCASVWSQRWVAMSWQIGASMSNSYIPTLQLNANHRKPICLQSKLGLSSRHVNADLEELGEGQTKASVSRHYSLKTVFRIQKIKALPLESHIPFISVCFILSLLDPPLQLCLCWCDTSIAI